MNCRSVLYPCKQGLASKRQEEALAEGVSLRPVMCYEQFQDEGNKKFQELQARRVKSILNLKEEKNSSVLEMVEAELKQKSYGRERVQSF